MHIYHRMEVACFDSPRQLKKDLRINKRRDNACLYCLGKARMTHGI